jgi:hypothetical protein
VWYCGRYRGQFSAAQRARVFYDGKSKMDHLPGFLWFVALKQCFDLHLPGGFVLWVGF